MRRVTWDHKGDWSARFFIGRAKDFQSWDREQLLDCMAAKRLKMKHYLFGIQSKEKSNCG
jgi:hypothetical protein